MTDLQSLLSELSANAKERNVKFIKDLTLNGKNMGKIGSFVIFTDENPFSVRESCKAPRVYTLDLNKDLKQWHYINTSIDGCFEGNKIRCRMVFNMRLEIAKELNYKYDLISFFYAYPTEDGFIAEYWDIRDKHEGFADRVLNPYVKKSEIKMQYGGETEVVDYSIICNDYKFYFDSSLLERVNNDISQRLKSYCETHNEYTDEDKLLEYVTNHIGQKIADIRKCIFGESVDDFNTGVDFYTNTKTVSYIPSYKDNVGAFVENTLRMKGGIMTNVKVWSIFKRKKDLRGDAYPLICAFKGEEGWTFKSETDKKAVEQQIELIANKFAKMYPVGVTILKPSENELNNRIAEIVMSKSKNAELIEGVICKITTEEVDKIVLDFDSKFRKYYGDNFNESYYKLGQYLDKMDKHRKGYFVRHFIKDTEMRDVLDFTLKVSDDRFAEFANKINGQDILIIDDTISRGQSITDVCKIMSETYAPKSLTVLTLLSNED